MTRRFDGLVQCPHCKEWHTAESGFERWMRDNEELDSRLSGIVRFDCDVLLHKYLVPLDKKGYRDIQCLMFIEVKSRGADVNGSQADTISLFSQVLRNRRTNIHQEKRGRHAQNHTPYCKAYSLLLKRFISLRMYGAHLLQMSHDSPVDSAWMAWDRKPIREETLLQVLRFEVDPDTLNPIDWRRRYSDFESQKLQTSLLF